MSELAGFLWGPPLVVLLLGGGIFFTAYCRFTPFRYFRHALEILTGKYDKDDDPGQISHFEALSSALASTVGMGYISGAFASPPPNNVINEIDEVDALFDKYSNVTPGPPLLAPLV